MESAKKRLEGLIDAARSKSPQKTRKEDIFANDPPSSISINLRTWSRSFDEYNHHYY